MSSDDAVVYARVTLGRGAEGVLERNQGGEPGSQRDSSAEILGRYALLTEIATGELTSIHLARQHGDSGFRRLVAVKRLKPLFARQPECVQLLADEANLTSGIHHANVIGCLDMGTEGGCYVVQPYVEGDNLEALLLRAGLESHPRYVVPLVVDVLNGLHAVHTALDADGVPLGLVHQAPHARHVLVGIDGIARLTDFTQAKACNVAPTRQRADRLKIQSMAPEQALRPESVDHRADLFLIGVLLWESLTGERLFAADDDAQTFQNVLHRRILRPSEVGRRPARCFDAICLRALERDPAKRYRSSLDMARELRDAALNQALYATTGEIGQWVKALAGPKLIERRRIAGADAGAEAGSTGPVPSASSTSGFFQSTQKADPYGSGLIFGGSYSRLAHDAPVDPDKTPAIGTRALLNAPARNAVARDEQPRRELNVERAARHGAGAVSERVRKDTEPYWQAQAGSEETARASGTPDARGFTPPPAREPFLPAPSVTPPRVDSPMAKLPAAPRVPQEAPLLAPMTPIQTPTAADRPRARVERPAGAAAAPGAGLREEGVKSPGAYSQVAPTRKRTSSPQPATASDPNIAPAARAEAPVAPVLGGGAERPSAPVLGGDRGSSPGVHQARTSSPALRGSSAGLNAGRPSRPRAAIDAPSEFDQRADSTPARLRVPSGPVGSPYGGASPSKGPVGFEPPPMPRALGGLTGRTRTADVLHGSVDSLAPLVVDAASRGRSADGATPNSSRSTWFVTGVLAAIILLAAGVSLRNKLQDATQPSRTTASQIAPAPAPVPVAAPVQVAAPVPVAPAPAVPAEPQAPGELAPAATEQAEQGRPPQLLAEPAAVGTEAVPDEAAPAQKSRTLSRAGRSRLKNPLPIPDNPY